MFEIFLRHAHDDCGIHLHEAAVGVISETFIPGRGGEAVDGAVVEAEIENGFHHSRHGAGRPRTHADEERVFRIAQLLPSGALELRDVIGDLLLQLRRILLAVFVKVIARFRGDGEAGWNRQADLGHLCETGAFAPEEIAPGSVTFRFAGAEEIHPFFHCTPRLSCLELWKLCCCHHSATAPGKDCRHADLSRFQVKLEVA